MKLLNRKVTHFIIKIIFQKHHWCEAVTGGYQTIYQQQDAVAHHEPEDWDAPLSKHSTVPAPRSNWPDI